MGLNITVYHRLPLDESIVRFWKENQWHPYGDMDYFSHEYENRTKGWSPFILAIRDNEKIFSCVIGRMQRLPVSFQFGYTVFHGPNLNTLTIHRTGLLGEWKYAHYELLQEKLWELMSSGSIEAVTLRATPRNSPMQELCRSRLSPLRRDHVQITQEHWLLNQLHSFEGFVKSHSNIKGTFRKHANRLRKSYGTSLAIKCYAEPYELDVMLEHSEKIARETWQRRVGEQSFLKDEVRSRYLFYCNLGWSRAFLLYIENNPVAFLHGIVYKNVFYAENKGYDPLYRSEGVGTYLLMQVIREMCEDPLIHSVDFNVGNDEDKKRYCSTSFSVSDIQLFGPGIKPQFLNLLHFMAQGSHQLGKMLAHRLGCYQSLRGRLR